MRRLLGNLGTALALLMLVGGIAVAKPPGKGAAKAPAAEQKPAAEKPEAEKPAPEKAGEQEKEDAKPDAEKQPETKPDDAKPGDAKSDDAKSDDKDKPTVHTVEKDLVKVEMSATGILEGKSSVPIALRTKEWKTLIVADAVEHGAQVSEGDVLVRFETEKIDQTIDDLKAAQRLAGLTLKQAEEGLRAMEVTVPMDLVHNERVSKYNSEDIERYFKVDRAMSIKSAEYSLKSYQEQLEYEEEELKQLQKMYEADDLTEETEEIILKRQRSAVERAKYYLETAKLRHERTMKISLPRDDIMMKDMTERQDVAVAKARVTLPAALSQQRIEVEKLQVAFERGEKRMQRLLDDREKLTVRSPKDGMVYLGKYVRGVWSNGTTVSDNMRPDGKVSSDDVFITVVQPDPLAVLITVPEKDLHWYGRGLKGIVRPTGFPELDLDAVVDRVDRVPLSAGKFTALLKVKNNDEGEALVPGMACSAKFVPYLKQRAIVAPAKAVFTDELNPRKRYVYLAADKGKPRKQPVEVGQKSGDNLEILDGLVEGDKILLERPKDEK